jgi:rfaE bifunctional protein nucleotidyltransferase chain/domain
MSGKILSIEEAITFAERMRDEGRTIVTTNGAFDLFHDGHKFLLTEAAKLGDVLIVGVNSDASVRGYKGPNRPIDPQQKRAEHVAQYADAVFIFDDADPRPWLPLIEPDVHANAETYGKRCIEADVLDEIGAQLALIPVKPELGSTTKILNDRS